VYSLARFSLLEMTECSAVLRQLGEQSSSLQDAASRAVDYLFRTLGNPDTGARDCVLVRCFKTVSYNRLNPMTQQRVREQLVGIAPFPDLKCFTLMATAGVESSRAFPSLPGDSDGQRRFRQTVSDVFPTFAPIRPLLQL
jgi:hypothetical protein